MGPILKVKNLSKHFDVSSPLITRLVSREEKSILKAVEGIGFEIKQGETVVLWESQDVENPPLQDWLSNSMNPQMVRYFLENKTFQASNLEKS